MSNWQDCRVSRDASIQEAMERIEECELQIAVITDADGALEGVATDGDIRRGLLQGVSLDAPVSQVMNPNPVVARQGESHESVARLMEVNRVHQIPVVNDRGQVVGLQTIDDLLMEDGRSNTVVIMAGGLGTRLRPITENRPKPLVEVEGVPILETLLERISMQGFVEVYLSVNYEAGMIEGHFEDGSDLNLHIEYLREKKRLGTAGPLSLLPERPEEPVLVVNGDLLTTLNFGRLIDFHDEQGVAATMGVRRYQTEVPYGVVDIENQRITGIEEKPTEQYFVNAGIYVLEPEVLDFVPANTFFDMPTLFQSLMDAGQELTAYPIQEYWRDIGEQRDLHEAQTEFSQVFA
jgi:dTDP-glucose pyrophosphorylase